MGGSQWPEIPLPEMLGSGTAWVFMFGLPCGTVLPGNAEAS